MPGSSIVPNLSGTAWNVRPNLCPRPNFDLSFADGATKMESSLDGANNSMTPVNLAVAVTLLAGKTKKFLTRFSLAIAAEYMREKVKLAPTFEIGSYVGNTLWSSIREQCYSTLCYSPEALKADNPLYGSFHIGDTWIGYAVYLPLTEEAATSSLKRELGAVNTSLASKHFHGWAFQAKKEEPVKPKPETGAEEEEAPKPKPKNPLDLLPPCKMILDGWKRLYSNTRTNFREVGGFLQTMELALKYAFGKILVIGSKPPFKVKGLAFSWARNTTVCA
ncbi:hypothetical protein CMV_015432 [Castanea mollissima]|uniref:EF-1-gamma C-terminal domain-containing protein n=1 Tax=Castanea mollissima TaxID=60419 RepID=A0A8J4VSN7_9ROSI|nr:hypothetical protein CMV_015432 [Castanea mollissima]